MLQKRLLAVLFVLIGLAPTYAGTIHVCWDGSGNYPTIQQGINAAGTGDEVVVCDGTYTGEGNRDLDFARKAITVRSQSDNPALCIIDCQGSGSDPHRAFDFYHHETATSVVRGFTIRNGYGGFGGAISCDAYSSPTIHNCIITGNVAEWGGAIECNNASNPIVSNCVITGNQASYGGAIDCYENCHPTIRNSTMTGNVGDYGGALCCWYGSRPTITNCTIAGNYGSMGGALYLYSEDSSGPTIRNCILWGDTPPEISIYSGNPTVTYSDVAGSWTGTGNINLDPRFVSAGSGDYRLGADSPCINTGDPSFVPQSGEKDLDGHARVLGGRVDMGAYEFDIGDYNGDRRVDLIDFAAFQVCFTATDSRSYPAGCEALDFDYDGDVDLVDFARFLTVFAGPAS